MNEFDIIDLVHDHVAAANTGMTIYKDWSLTGVQDNHIVIGMLDYNHLDWNNVLPVNVNIFVQLAPNGMPKRTVMKKPLRNTNRAEENKTRGGQYRSIIIEAAIALKSKKASIA